jgi:putative hydroxymethylpyrimidine transport system substrate-binding protein
MHRALGVVPVAMLVALVPIAFAGPAERVTLTLDWTPNPDHVGFYDAEANGLFARAGLDVTIRAPSDPTAPLKLVGAGTSDLAVSYEQELFFAATKKLPVVAVAAVVPQPLNSIIAIEREIKSGRDLKGKTIGITGVPSDYATLDTALRSAGLARRDVRVVTVGYNLLPALLAHHVDAVLGVYRNIEGIQLQLRGLHPSIIPVDRLGVPTYDELVLVANRTRLRDDASYRSMVRRFVAALIAGTSDARGHPAEAIVVLKRVTASDAKFLARAVPATLRLLNGPDGAGCLAVSAWQRFGDWMRTSGLLKRAVPAVEVVDPSFLPSRCRKAGQRAGHRARH